MPPILIAAAFLAAAGLVLVAGVWIGLRLAPRLDRWANRPDDAEAPAGDADGLDGGGDPPDAVER